MREVGVLEAKTNLSALLNEVETTGEPIAITRHGRRVARIERERTEKDAAEWKAWVKELVRKQDEMAAANPKMLEPYDLRADLDSIE